MRGNRSELAPGRKSPWCHVNTPLVPLVSNGLKLFWVGVVNLWSVAFILRALELCLRSFLGKFFGR